MSETVVNIILYHHERYDGKGYPTGLKGEQIPIESRIVALADVFDALYSDRPYRKAYDFDQAMEIMGEMTETHFDRRLAKLFLPITEQARKEPSELAVMAAGIEV
jgi:putative two-component system response regulator